SRATCHCDAGPWCSATRWPAGSPAPASASAWPGSTLRTAPAPPAAAASRTCARTPSSPAGRRTAATPSSCGRGATSCSRCRAAWAGGYDDEAPWPLDAAVTFAPVGSVVVAALTALAPGATVAVNAIHLDGMPAFDYDLLWQERAIRSVANFTRADASEFLALAAEIPIGAQVQECPLAAAGQ